MKSLLLIILLGALTCEAQVTDNDIVQATVGKSYFRMHKALDSLGVWYHLHMDVEKVNLGKSDSKKIYSVADGKGNVKVYSIKLSSSNIVDEIIINFRHDKKEDVLAISAMNNHSGFHVGIFSTDIVFKKGK
jgi:hypothetical protein